MLRHRFARLGKFLSNNLELRVIFQNLKSNLSKISTLIIFFEKDTIVILIRDKLDCVLQHGSMVTIFYHVKYEVKHACSSSCQLKHPNDNLTFEYPSLFLQKSLFSSFSLNSGNLILWGVILILPISK